MVKLSLPEKFKDARVSHNQHGKQTMAEVQAATGVQASTISDLENENKSRNAGYMDIVKLAHHYGVSLEYLIGNSDDPRIHVSAVDELGLSNKALDIIREEQKWHTEKYYLSFLSKIIEDSSTVAIRELYYKYSFFRELYAQREELRTSDLSELCKQTGIVLGENVTPELLGFNFSTYCDYLYDQMKRAEFEILFELSAALNK